MKKIFLIFIVLWIEPLAFAKGTASANPKTRRPAQVPALSIKFKVVYGDKVSLFVFTKNKSGAELNFSTSMGDRVQKQISAADFNFLRTRVAALAGPSNSKEYCARKFMSFWNEKREEKIGCIGSQNKLAKEMLSTVNLASTLL